jgi:exodeoxyribonuclease V alpha subunit
VCLALDDPALDDPALGNPALDDPAPDDPAPDDPALTGAAPATDASATPPLVPAARATPTAATVTTVARLRRDLLASGVVGTPQAPQALPLILDDQDRLYLHRYFDYERRLARRLMQAATAPAAPIDAASRAALRLQFAAAGAPRPQPQPQPQPQPDWQQLAAALALRQRLVIISGGPGTGKTTTVVNLLACLIAHDGGCRIALAAPTGKAAARMTEAIRARAQHLPPQIRARLPAESFTIHRLLGVRPDGDGFVHHADNLLAIDVLVVDEASMLDLALATQLLEAVPQTARIVLLGDKDQLAAVEAGAVFAELSADPSLTDACRADLAAWCDLQPAQIAPPEPGPGGPGALRDAVVWFTRNFRFARDSGIGRLAADINARRASPAIAWLRQATDPNVTWLEDPGAEPAPSVVQQLLDGYAPYLAAVERDPSDRAAITAAFGAFRALGAVRDGPRGVSALNDRVTRHARAMLARVGAAQSGTAGSEWYAGRPVLVTRNDYVLKLFNGDIGITLPDPSGALMVFFPDATAGLRAVAPLRLRDATTAFAMTVHKSQGSEFDAVLVVLPQQASRVVTRELLYTAVTRARQRVAIAASEPVLTAAITSQARRSSGLLTRLREAL